MMKIGIDIDEVVCEYIKHFLNYLEESRGINLLYEDVYDCNLKGPLQMTSDEVHTLVGEHTSDDAIVNFQLIGGAKNAIKMLDDHHEIFFITSRHPKCEKATIKFFKKHFPKRDFKIIFSNEAWHNENKSKSEICSDLGVSVLIEDNPNYSLDCASNGIKVFLMDKPWNKWVNHEQISRVKNWNEIMENLNEN